MLYISDFCQFHCNSTLSHSHLKQHIQSVAPNLSPRRLDRLTLLSLAGAIQCDKDKLNSESSLYLFALSQCLENMETALTQIYTEKLPPKPFNFIHSVSNAACFYVAKALSINMRNILIASDKTVNDLIKAYTFAQSDLKRAPNSSILVGFVTASRHSSKIKIPESSFWITLSLNPDNAIATIDINTQAGINANSFDLNDFLTKAYNDLNALENTPSTVANSPINILKLAQ